MDVTDHTSFLSSSFAELLASGKNSDVTLVVQNEKIPVHRLILANKSHFFDVLFYGNQFKESDETEITIDAPLEALKHILQYMYTGILCLTEISTETLLDVLELSRRFCLEELEAALTESLGTRITNENLVDVIHAAELLDSEKLIKQCWTRMSDDFFGSESFLSLKFNEIVYCFTHKDTSLSVLVEFHAISRWCLANLECKDKDKLLDTIDLSALSNDQLLDVVRPTQLVPPEKLLDLIALRQNEVLQFKGMKKDGNTDQSATRIDGVTVVSGMNPENAFSTTAFTTGVRMNNEWIIDFDLGDVLSINHVRFNIGNATPCTFTIHLSTELLKWNFCRRFQLCSRHQDVYCNTVSARYIQVKGVKLLNSFEVFHETALPVISPLGYISPSENVCTAEKAFVVDRPGDQILNEVCENRGVATPYTEVPVEGIEIRFNQPYLLQNFKLRLWDFDEREASFKMSRIGTNNRTYLVRKFELADGWQIFSIMHPEFCSGLKIVPNKEMNLRIVHIEASA